MRNSKGFTLVEVVITAIIISMLSVIGLNVYKNRIKDSKYAEGMRLLQSIKEQQDLSLSFGSSDTTKSPFFYTDNKVVKTTFTINRNAQNLGNFHIYPHHYKYFKEFEIRKPNIQEENKYNVIGDGYVIEAYFPNKDAYQLKVKLIGSTEGAYTFVKE